MKCWIYKKRLHLHRQGELTAREKKSLEKHLSSCDGCRREAAGILAVEEGAALLREEKPALSRPEEMTDAVMRRIRAGMADRRTQGQSVLLSVLFGRIPRFVYAVLAAGIIGTFFYQEYRMLAKISRLEQRMAAMQAGAGVISAERAWDRLSDGLLTAGPVTAVGAVKPKWDAGDDWILIRRSELDSLIRQYRDFRSAPVEDMEMIRRILIRLDQSGYPVPDPAVEMDWIIKHRREWLQRIDRL